MADALGNDGREGRRLDISQEKAEIRAQAIIRSGGTARSLSAATFWMRIRFAECSEKTYSTVWGPPDLLDQRRWRE